MATTAKARPRSRATDPDTSCVYVKRFVRSDGSEALPRRIILADAWPSWRRDFNSLSHASGVFVQAAPIPLPDINGDFAWEGGAA